MRNLTAEVRHPTDEVADLTPRVRHPASHLRNLTGEVRYLGTGLPDPVAAPLAGFTGPPRALGSARRLPDAAATPLIWPPDRREAMTAHRVKFDFVVHFTNGGSLSAQDFRLDIPGSDISDDQLAAHLIQDMRLLMAGRVDITNKQVIKEPHKRQAIPTDDLPRATVDLADAALSASELISRARHHPIRVVAGDGESYTLSRLVA